MNKEFITQRLGSFPKGTDFIISITRNSLPEVGQGEAQQHKYFCVYSKSTTNFVRSRNVLYGTYFKSVKMTNSTANKIHSKIIDLSLNSSFFIFHFSDSSPEIPYRKWARVRLNSIKIMAFLAKKC